MLVQNILKTKEKMGIIWLTPTEKVAKAAKVMADNRIGTIVVSNDGLSAVGILSERDIVREIGKRGAGVLDETIDKLMTADPVTTTLDKNNDEVLQVMTDRRFRHLPVVEDGQLVGLVSIGDVVKARLSELAMEKDALEGMVMGR